MKSVWKESKIDPECCMLHQWVWRLHSKITPTRRAGAGLLFQHQELRQPHKHWEARRKAGGSREKFCLDNDNVSSRPHIQPGQNTDEGVLMKILQCIAFDPGYVTRQAAICRELHGCKKLEFNEAWQLSNWLTLIIDNFLSVSGTFEYWTQFPEHRISIIYFSTSTHNNLDKFSLPQPHFLMIPHKENSTIKHQEFKSQNNRRKTP